MLRGICVWFSLFLLALLALPIARAAPFFSDGLHAVFTFDWDPARDRFGMLLSLLGSFEMVLLSLPLTVICAWALAYQLTHSRSARLRAAVLSLLHASNSIPSVVIGIWGINQLAPAVRHLRGTGYCIVTTVVGLAIMTLPTTSLLLLQAYGEYRRQYEGLERSLDFGWAESTRFFAKSARAEIRHVWLYTYCRLFGETTVVLMLSGNAILVPSGPFMGFRTLTSSIALEMAYATGKHEQALYVLAAASVLCTAVAIAFGPTQRLRAAAHA